MCPQHGPLNCHVYYSRDLRATPLVLVDVGGGGSGTHMGKFNYKQVKENIQ